MSPLGDDATGEWMWLSLDCLATSSVTDGYVVVAVLGCSCPDELLVPFK